MADSTPSSTPPQYALFDAVSVGAATFLGAPLAGSIVMALNYTRLKRVGAAATVLAIGGALTSVTLFLAVAVSSQALNAVPIASFLAMFFAARTLQGPAVELHQRQGGPLASRWIAAGIGLAVLIPLLAMVAVGTLITGSSKVVVGARDEVLYSATAADVHAFGQALQSIPSAGGLPLKLRLANSRPEMKQEVSLQ